MIDTPVIGDQHFVKTINRTVLLRALFAEPAQSRAALSERTGLTKSTVSSLVNELLEEGWVAEESAAGTGTLGRPPTPLRIDGSGLVLIGSELGVDSIRVVSTTVHGEVLNSLVEPLRDRLPELALHQLSHLITAEAARATQAGGQLLGIGVGLPGTVDVNRGVIDVAPNLGWRGVAVRGPLSRGLQKAGLQHIPLHCLNEADAAVIGESEFGDNRSDGLLVYVSCNAGVGAGIVLNGALFAGSTGAGGEIGHTIMHPDGRQCSCGRKGCAEAYIGLRAVATAVGIPSDREVTAVSLAAALARRKPPRRDKAFENAGDALGVLLQNVWSTFRPTAIVLGGEVVTLGGSSFLDAAVARLGRFGEDAGSLPPSIRLAKYGEQATAVGGAAFVLHTVLRPYAG
ncbi:ROK family transcriptional regulator [Roseateles sp. P5_E7]